MLRVQSVPRRESHRAAFQRFPSFRREKPSTIPSTVAGMSCASSRRAATTRDALHVYRPDLLLSSLTRSPLRADAPAARRAMQRLCNVWNAAALRMRAAYLTRNRRTAGSVMFLNDDLTIVCGDLTGNLRVRLSFSPSLFFSHLFASPTFLSLVLPRNHSSS